jgi:hypothetical protein
VDGFKPAPALPGIGPQQQPQGPGRSGGVLRHGGIFQQRRFLARQNWTKTRGMHYAFAVIFSKVILLKVLLSFGIGLIILALL